jgi:hypothetical protein
MMLYEMEIYTVGMGNRGDPPLIGWGFPILVVNGAVVGDNFNTRSGDGARAGIILSAPYPTPI